MAPNQTLISRASNKRPAPPDEPSRNMQLDEEDALILEAFSQFHTDGAHGSSSLSSAKRQKQQDTRTAFVDGTGWTRPVCPKPATNNNYNNILVISDDEGDSPKETTKARSLNQAAAPPAPWPLVARPPVQYPATPASSQPASSFNFRPKPSSAQINSSPGPYGPAIIERQTQVPKPQPASQPSGDLPSQSSPRSTPMPQFESQSTLMDFEPDPAPVIPPNGDASSHDRPALLDHTGKPLSARAVDVARRYWECVREYELFPVGALAVQGPQPEKDPLMRMMWYRRSYTELILDVDELGPGARTYEPPYVPPEIHISIPATPEPAAPRVESSPHDKEQVADLATPDPAAPDPAAPDPAAPDPVASDPELPLLEPHLNEEQQRVVDLAATGRNIFYTGSAGCGKSTVLNAIKKRLEAMGKFVHVIAPTGKVALAINGTTTWTFAGWTPDTGRRKLAELTKMASFKRSPARKRFRQADVIIIDEISMVENLHFERLNAVMKAGRYIAASHQNGGIDARKLAFGGVQVIVTGDFCQLPPVKPFSTCMFCGKEFTIDRTPDTEDVYNCHDCNLSYKDSDKWAFRSKAWQECQFEHIMLDTIHRQHDSTFIDILQKCRLGKPFTPNDLDLLANHPSVTGNAVKLYSTRREVQRTNDEAFQKLKTPSRTYRCYDRFKWNKEKHPTLQRKGDTTKNGTLIALSDHRLEPTIDLKQGMLVVLLANLNLEDGLCNGSQGIIAGFEPYDRGRLPRYRGETSTNNPDPAAGGYAIIKENHVREFSAKQLSEGDLAWPIVKFLTGKTRTIYPECQINELGDTKPYSLLCRTQVPLTAAWALSIHRSQGMTLNRVIVDLSHAFEEGQVYVALSRATSLEGLKIEGNLEGLKVGLGGNRAVREWLEETFGAKGAGFR